MQIAVSPCSHSMGKSRTLLLTIYINITKHISSRLVGVAVSTTDSDSVDGGSIPSRAFLPLRNLTICVYFGQCVQRMLEIPRTQGFLYCITLKFGVYIICSFDVFSSIFVCFSLTLVLLNPNIIAETNSRSDILWTSPESMPSLRAHLLLAAITLVMGVIGMMGVRSDYLEHLIANAAT